MRDSLLMLPEPGPGAFVIGPLRGRTGMLMAGEADCTVRDLLCAALAALAADGAEVIHLDLTELGFIDVCCTRELIAVTERHPAVRLVVYHPPASMRRITAILHPEAKIEFIDPPRLGAAAANGRSGQIESCFPAPATREGPPTPDIMELILAEHVRIRKLIDGLDSALLDAGPAGPGSDSALAWASLARFLRLHVDAAEEIAYQELAGAGPDAAVAVVQASETDADIRIAIEEAQLSRPGSLTWHMAVQATCSAARSHIVRVESGPLPFYEQHTALRAGRILGRQWVGFMAARALDASAGLAQHRRFLAYHNCS